jgi:hypothetical protein
MPFGPTIAVVAITSYITEQKEYLSVMDGQIYLKIMERQIFIGYQKQFYFIEKLK